MRPSLLLLLAAAALSAAEPLPPGAVARCGTAPLRHPGIPGEANGFAFRPDGKVPSAAVWGTRDGSAVVWVASWDAATRARHPDFDPKVGMSSYRMSEDGRLIGIRPPAGWAITVWDVAAGKSVGRIDVGAG